MLTYPPIAVFEIVSPEDSYSRLIRELEDYEKMGVPYVFFVDPERILMTRYARGSLMISEAEVPLLQTTGGLVHWPKIVALLDQ